MGFWRGVFSDGDQPSFSRVASGAVVFFALGWVTHIVWRSHALPDFGGLALFIGTLYGLNVAGNAINKKPPTT